MAERIGMGRRIRIWKEEAMYHVTYQCIDRMFLLKPSQELNNALGAALGRALETSPVEVHSATTNINHLELNISLRKGEVANASNFGQRTACTTSPWARRG